MLELFSYEGRQVRTVTIDGEPWFVLTDLTRVLGLRQFRVERLGDGLIQNHPIPDRLGREQATWIVSEAGMYEVVIRSDKPEAAAFRRWVTGTVLPQIRKTGSYGAQPALTDDQIVHQALTILTAKTAELEAKVEADAPKVGYVDRFVGQTSDAVTVDVFASQFGTTGPKVRELLHEKRVAVRKFLGERWSSSEQRMVKEYEWRPRQGVESSAWFDLRPQHNAPRLHNGQVKQTMYVRQFHAQELAMKLGIEEVAA